MKSSRILPYHAGPAVLINVERSSDIRCFLSYAATPRPMLSDPKAPHKAVHLHAKQECAAVNNIRMCSDRRPFNYACPVPRSSTVARFCLSLSAERRAAVASRARIKHLFLTAIPSSWASLPSHADPPCP